MLPFGVTIFSFFTHTGEKKHKEKPWETTAEWEGTLTFLEKDIAQRRGNPRRGFPLFLAMPKIHPFLRFFALGYFGICGCRPGALPLDPTSFSS